MSYELVQWGGPWVAWSRFEREALFRALLSAFPSWVALATKVDFGLDENLPVLAPSQGLYAAGFELIQWADAHDRLDDLLRTALPHNPGNKALRLLAAARLHQDLQPPLAAVSMGPTHVECFYRGQIGISTTAGSTTKPGGLPMLRILLRVQHRRNDGCANTVDKQILQLQYTNR
jgi:hypothetical protein